MGQKGSKRDEAYFTEYEYLRLADLFRIDKNNLSTANADTFRAVWSQFMETSLMETWIQYFIRNEFHYHFHVTFDLGRLSLLYKGQTSPFMDVKSQAIMRVILGTSATDRVLAVNHSRVIEYFRDVITSYMRCVEVIRHTNYVKWRAIGCTAEDIPRIQMISYFLSNLSVTDGQVTELDLEMWLRDRVFVDDVLGTLLDFSFSFNQLDDNYHTVIPFPLTNQATIIDIAHVLFLNAHLTTMLKRNWALAYSSVNDGLVFSRFSNKIKDIGPTIIIIKETGGYIFGCYASESWKSSPGFYGDSRCFSFQLVPECIHCEASGHNTNFMYHTFNQMTLANGLGFGGQIGYWGIWLDGDFRKGRCESFCSTFKNFRCLSRKNDFQIERLEVWAVEGLGFIAMRDESERIAADTILNKDPTAKALLEMTNIKNNELLS